MTDVTNSTPLLEPGTHWRNWGRSQSVTPAHTARPTSIDAALANFDRVWWLIVAGGLLTSLLSLPLPLRTRRPSAADAADEAEDVALALVPE